MHPENCKEAHVSASSDNGIKYQTWAKLQRACPLLLPVVFIRAPNVHHKLNYSSGPALLKQATSVSALIDLLIFSLTVLSIVERLWLPYC